MAYSEDAQMPDASLDQIKKEYELNPSGLCKVGGKLITFRTAYYMLVFYAVGGSHKAATGALNISHSSGLLRMGRAPQESREAMMDKLGLTEVHIANTILDATLANKKKYMVDKGQVIETREDPDYDVRLKAAEMASRLRGMNAPEKIELSGLETMSAEKVTDIVRSLNQKIIPGQFEVLPDGEKEEKEK